VATTQIEKEKGRSRWVNVGRKKKSFLRKNDLYWFGRARVKEILSWFSGKEKKKRKKEGAGVLRSLKKGTGREVENPSVEGKKSTPRPQEEKKGGRDQASHKGDGGS